MLEFIVLGEVPGTQIVITYQWALLLGISLLGIVFAKRLGKRVRDNQQQEPAEEITL